jgi:hypothetical protein
MENVGCLLVSMETFVDPVDAENAFVLSWFPGREDKKLKSRFPFIQIKTILDFFLRGFSISSCPQHSLKVLLL